MVYLPHAPLCPQSLPAPIPYPIPSLKSLLDGSCCWTWCGQMCTTFPHSIPTLQEHWGQYIYSHPPARRALVVLPQAAAVCTHGRAALPCVSWVMSSLQGSSQTCTSPVPWAKPGQHQHLSPFVVLFPMGTIFPTQVDRLLRSPCMLPPFSLLPMLIPFTLILPFPLLRPFP